MPPGKTTRKQSYDDVSGEGDDIVIRIMEALTDERILNILKKALYPQPLCDKIDEMNAKMANLTEQVTQRDCKINELEKRIFVLEDSCDRAEQYTRRSNLVFRGLAEQGQGENTEAIVTAFVNDHMKLPSPLLCKDIARCHRLGAQRSGTLHRPIIVRFASDRSRDVVYRARANLKDFNGSHRGNPVYINDDLTSRRAKIAFDCHSLKKQKKISDTWTFNGKILIKDLTGKVTEINSAAALTQY